VTTAARIPKTTARPPTRPMCPPAPMAIYIQGMHRLRGRLVEYCPCPLSISQLSRVA
jgi:hypothetical protein